MTATKVKDTVTVAEISKKTDGRPIPPGEKIKEKLEAMTFTLLDAAPGDSAAEPSDAIASTRAPFRSPLTGLSGFYFELVKREGGTSLATAAR